VCEAALRTTATYTSERRQFDTPIATFQAVAHRAADAYIDTEAVRLTAHQAAWRLGEGLPADEALAIAKFWAGRGRAPRRPTPPSTCTVASASTRLPGAPHLPLGPHLELSLGGGTAHLRRLGALLRTAASPGI
jgi:hypothetical protein